MYNTAKQINYKSWQLNLQLLDQEIRNVHKIQRTKEKIIENPQD